MSLREVCCLACVLWGAAPLAAQTPFGRVERLAPEFDALIAPEAAIEKLADGFDWSEGPVWDRAHQRLLFSDIPPNRVMQWREGQGVSLFLHPSGYTGDKPRAGEPGSNGLLFDEQGRLILCQHGDRRIVRIEPDGSWTTLVDRFEGKRLNSPNDAAISSRGDLYFTDPPYGLEGNNADPAKELPFNGVYRQSADGRLTLLSREISFPNGIALSPDEKTLYVACSDPKRAVWYAFDVQPDGQVGKPRVLFDATAWVGQRKGLPDGMKVDSAGNLFATGPGGVLVLTPQGRHLGTIDPGEATANCGWGDDGSTLYMTSDMNLCRIRTKTKGPGW